MSGALTATPTSLLERAESIREHTLAFVAHLDDEQLMGPRLVLNPLLWEIGHIAWFMERWVFRRDGGDSVLPSADPLYDSANVAHETRWDLPLPARGDTQTYMRQVLDRVGDHLESGKATPEDLYHVTYAIGHEEMHCEAFTRTLQWHGWPAPSFSGTPEPIEGGGACAGDADCAGGPFVLGATPDDGFVFDNEKWGHEVQVAPFSIARAPVTQGQYAAFVLDDGYEQRAHWCEAGWAWRDGVRLPRYWRRDGDTFERQDFDRWVPLEPHRPVCHVSWFEASAYCRWAGRRLPTEAEWEMAASFDGTVKRRYPWGQDRGPANFDWRVMGSVDVGALPEGDSAIGCRQMMGNVWEWTADVFGPYPGFTPDPYKEYSAPWFGDHYVLKGGSWAGCLDLHRATYRKYHEPHRQDVFGGFRTCACT